jgi:uncharacterized membrane protein
MTRYRTAASTLSAAIGLALGLQLAPLSAQEMKKEPSAMDKKEGMKEKGEKCYGINAVSKNDCAAGAHSCAGQSTKARDPNSFVLLPAGACSKIDGGKVKSS